jgi:hypothetical protein
MYTVQDILKHNEYYKSRRTTLPCCDGMKTEILVDDFGRSLRIPLRFSLVGQARKIEGGFRSFKVKDYVSLVPTNSKGDKVAILEELEFDDGKRELRLGYYIIGHRGRMKGKWAWGQYALFIPAEDLVKLVEKAREKGIL